MSCNCGQPGCTTCFTFQCDPCYKDVSNDVVFPRPGTRVFNKPVQGLLNGSNVSFSVEFNYATGTLAIYIDGVRVSPSIITEIDKTTFEINPAPTGSEIIADFTIAE